MKRRDFVTASAVAVGAGVFAAASPTHAIDPFQRRKPGTLKLSLAAYSLRKHLTKKPGEEGYMSLFDFVDFCHEQKLPGAELTSYYFPEEVSHEYLMRLKRHCHLRGVSISGGAIRNDFCSRDEEKIATDLAHTRTWVEHYAKLGAPAIRIFAGKKNKGEELSEALDRCVRNCQIACDHAAESGVMLALENHGGVTAFAKDLLTIVKQIESPAFGVNFDSGNFRSTEDPYLELEQIAPYAVNAQVKIEVAPMGRKQPADLARIISILKESGYSGWVALEYEAEEEPLKAIPEWLNKLRELL